MIKKQRHEVGQHGNVTINYDPDYDVLYLSKKGPVPSYSNSAKYEGPGKILIRSGMEGEGVTGATILDYSRVPKVKLREFINFNVNWDAVNKKIKEEGCNSASEKNP